MKYKVLKKQNSSKSCLVCGVENDLGLKARFYQLENGELVSIFNSKEFHQSYPGRVHGGISAAILDETIGRAISISDETIWGVTGSLEIRYKKPVPLDCEIITVARVTRDTRKLFEGTGEIILPNGDIAVTASAKYVKMPVAQITDECNMTEEWLDIPDDDPVQYIEIPGR
ncbi:MAG: PaaI family thioesterase [Intestinibacter sp.]|uniref:PaaI family thioesterase n=1 Tax=Intestinibacter sp. TaxID=1965304 RepID=UPI003F1376EE